MRGIIIFIVACTMILTSAMPGCIEGLLSNEEKQSDPNMPPEPQEPEPSDGNFENMEALMTALDPVLEQLPWDQMISLADTTLGVGNTVKDLSDPYMRHWAAKTYYEEGTKLHMQSINIYPGYGNPYYNDAGNFIDANFESRNGLNLSGRIFLPAGYDINSPLSDRLPLLVFCQGVATNKEQYYGWAQYMAKNNYIVYTFDVSGQGASEGAGADTWAFRVNDTVDAITYMLYDSPVKHCIDSQKIGTFGHSMGGINVLEHQAVDDRVKAVVSAAPITKYNVNMATSDIPIQIQTADSDGPVAPFPMMCPAITKQI
ncbi:MAG: alpha/beta fold hydrolase, partial [Candidatus Thermoplasmatota archaeon]|nr:alpha/beta fold hydrolase [Candidatus Thermoplasmatota archaeon]